MSKRKVKKYVDDGRTIYNMDVEGMPHRRKRTKSDINLTKQERRSMTRAAFKHYFPIVLGVMVCFTIVALLLYFWLR